MKWLPLIACVFSGSLVWSQQSEDLIPKDAVTVFSINNISLLQKVSLDDLVKYEFMEELQAELFDGSTNGKTLKDSGLDFGQKLNVFYGKGTEYEVSGFTFGINDKQALFQVFDDFEQIQSPYQGVEFYASYFNNLIIKGDAALLIRVEPLSDKIDEMTDSIWYARGNDNPWFLNDMMDQLEEQSDLDEEIYEEGIEEEDTEEDYDVVEDNKHYSSEDQSAAEKNYYELRDSVQLVLQNQFLYGLCEDLLVGQVSLKSSDERFAEQLTHNSEGIFFLDNSRNMQQARGLWYFQTMFPSLYDHIRELYTGNVILGDLLLNDQSVEFKMEARYGDALGSIYEKMNSAKFDKKVLSYIPENSAAYFTYNINLREAYEQAYKVIMPILETEKNPQISANVLTIELLNEFINKDALFDTYKGSMFGSFNGIKKIKTSKIEFYYDEETFEYGEREVEAEADMPVFTLGFSTARADIPEKVLEHLAHLTSRFKNMGDYWVFENAILESAPLYMINKNGLFILTNDEDLAKNHSGGYGKGSLSKTAAKKAMKSGFMYGLVNWAQVLDKMPREFFNEHQNEILDAMRGKTGTMELTTTKTTRQKTNFDIIYSYTGNYENSGKYLLDLLNSVYVISK